MLLEPLDVNSDPADEDGETPHSWAADHGHEGVVNRLLEPVDLDPNTTDKDGPTGLFWPVNNEHG